MVKIEKVLDDVTATTTSNPVDIRGARKVTLICERDDHGSGSSAFTGTVYATATDDAASRSDGVAYKRWISNATNTNSQTIVRVQTLTLSSDTTDFMTMSPEDAFEQITITVTETTDGTHSAWLVVDYGPDYRA